MRVYQWLLFSKHKLLQIKMNNENTEILKRESVA